MKILQLPTEIAGQVNLTARGLRAIGFDAKNACRPNPLGYPTDINPCFSHVPLLGNTRNPFLFFSWAREFDLFHYHKSPYLPAGLDVRYLKRKKRPFFIEFWGSDIRLYDLEKARNPYFEHDNASNQQRKRDRLAFWSDMTGEVIMSDNSADIFLQPYFETIHIVRQRVDTSLYQPAYPDPENRRPKIVHAPSVQEIKGTEFIEKAVEDLERKGLAFDYVRVQGVPHARAMRMYSEADIVVDELRMGSYGILSCEAMALGKPVICYILEELVDTYPEGFPIVNANPDTITEVLEELIRSPQRRHEIGLQGRRYVEKVHDIKEVAKRLVKIYESRYGE